MSHTRQWLLPLSFMLVEENVSYTSVIGRLWFSFHSAFAIWAEQRCTRTQFLAGFGNWNLYHIKVGFLAGFGNFYFELQWTFRMCAIFRFAMKIPNFPVRWHVSFLRHKPIYRLLFRGKNNLCFEKSSFKLKCTLSLPFGKEWETGRPSCSLAISIWMWKCVLNKFRAQMDFWALMEALSLV